MVSSKENRSNSEIKSDQFKPLYKQHRRVAKNFINENNSILLPSDCEAYRGPYSVTLASKHSQCYQESFDELLNHGNIGSTNTSNCQYSNSSYSIVSIEELPGLQILPKFIPPNVQTRLIQDIVDEYVPNKLHKSNLTPHYILPDPLKLFDIRQDTMVQPKVEFPFLKPLSISQIRDSKLRWITLGGQYNWTDKIYPSFEEGSEHFPQFPSKLGKLLNRLFDINCEAAIVNFYSPGDTLSPHQDVAELCDADLISVSIGCDCIFYCGNSRNEEPLSILLQSGDVVIMGGQSRRAFHGVGRVFENTCPQYLLGIYDGWMKSKRVNLNVRQMLPLSN